MLEYMAFPHLFHVLFQNEFEAVSKWLFLDAFPHLFVSATSLTWFDFQLLMGTID